jgi:hypothetical protein
LYKDANLIKHKDIKKVLDDVQKAADKSLRSIMVTKTAKRFGLDPAKLKEDLRTLGMSKLPTKKSDIGSFFDTQLSKLGGDKDKKAELENARTSMTDVFERLYASEKLGLGFTGKPITKEAILEAYKTKVNAGTGDKLALPWSYRKLVGTFDTSPTDETSKPTTKQKTKSDVEWKLQEQKAKEAIQNQLDRTTDQDAENQSNIEWRLQEQKAKEAIQNQLDRTTAQDAENQSNKVFSPVKGTYKTDSDIQSQLGQRRSNFRSSEAERLFKVQLSKAKMAEERRR